MRKFTRVTALLLVLLSCGTLVDDVRPPQRLAVETVTLRPRPGRPHVEVTEAQFRQAMQGLFRDPHLRSLINTRARQEGLVRVAGVPFDQLQLAMTAGYRAWCARRHGSDDCLALLRDGPYLSDSDKYAIAFDIALGSHWDGFASELEGMANPMVVKTILLSAMVTYMALLVFPELGSKVVAGTLALAAAAWLGAETLWKLLGGWVDMARGASSARTFEELHQAGDTYGRVIGAQTARVLVMLVTALLTEGGLVAKAPGLPGAPQPPPHAYKDLILLGLTPGPGAA